MRTQSGYWYCVGAITKRFFLWESRCWPFESLPVILHRRLFPKHALWVSIFFLSNSFPPSVPSSHYTRLCAGAFSAMDLCVLHERADKPVPQVKRGGQAFHRRRPKTSWKKEVDKHGIHTQRGMNFCVTCLKNWVCLIRRFVTGAETDWASVL